MPAMTGRPAFGLYLHIPFCRHRCAYCDFNTYTTVDDLMEEYIAALLKEVRQVAGRLRRPAATVYFGGGTPSLLPVEAIQVIIDEIRGTFLLDDQAEITMEANPENVTPEYLAAVRDAGVNRLSMGAQSADPGQLALLERQHTFDTVIRAFEEGLMAGFDNISLDLIYGLPGQDLASWEDSLAAAQALGPQHLSLYCLTIEPGTPMSRWLANGRIEAPDPDLAADQFELACQILAAQGFEHYEISNWARPDFACRHNLIYWHNDSYLGFGAGAHGHAAGYRYSVVKQPRVYIRRMYSQESGRFPWSAAVSEKRLLSRQDMMADTVITQLRLLEEGLDLDHFAGRFGIELTDAFPGICEQLVDWKLLQQSERRMLLTERGRFLSNQVFYRFM